MLASYLILVHKFNTLSFRDLLFMLYLFGKNNYFTAL